MSSGYVWKKCDDQYFWKKCDDQYFWKKCDDQYFWKKCDDANQKMIWPMKRSADLMHGANGPRYSMKPRFCRIKIASS